MSALPRQLLTEHRGAAIGAGLLAAMALAALAAPAIVPLDPQLIAPFDRLRSPDAQYWFGTDQIGRDVFSRTVYGARVSILVGCFVAVISILAGLILGSVIIAFTASECSVQSQLKECHHWRKTGQYQITEGMITDFQEDPSQSRKWERFSIGNQTFTVSRGAPPCHFEQTKYWAGPFDAGKKVRIYHQGDIILKIEML